MKNVDLEKPTSCIGDKYGTHKHIL